nr:MAG TPA: hypothetical protein [Caudoviricetes sp.]
MVVVVVVVASIYIRGARTRARARVYTITGMVVKGVSRKKRQKKTLEHSPTLPTAHRRCENQMISVTP